MKAAKLVAAVVAVLAVGALALGCAPKPTVVPDLPEKAAFAGTSGSVDVTFVDANGVQWGPFEWNIAEDGSTFTVDYTATNTATEAVEMGYPLNPMQDGAFDKLQDSTRSGDGMIAPEITVAIRDKYTLVNEKPIRLEIFDPVTLDNVKVVTIPEEEDESER